MRLMDRISADRVRHCLSGEGANSASHRILTSGLTVAAAASLLCLAGCSSLATRSAVGPGQHPQAFEKTITKHVGCKYLLFLPEDYAKPPTGKRWPLILFLHGAGERGENVELVKTHGPPKLVAKDPRFGFIVVSPQCPADDWWSPDILNALLDEVIACYRVDPDRVYLTGLSMGGLGTWELAEKYPDRFAAIAPVCGMGMSLAAKRIKHIPVWIFHGAKDGVVPLRDSEEMAAALKKCGADVKLTVYPDAGHDAWTQTYNNPELYEWFLKYRRHSAKPEK